MSILEYSMRQHDTRLWGRARGAAVRADIERALTKLSSGDVLGLNLSGVEVMDFSFASEVIGKLLYRMPVEYPDQQMVLLGASNYVKENLDAALRGMGLAALVLHGNGWEVIGKFGEADLETLRELAVAKSATAGEMARGLGISITACNNRLRKLTDLGLIRRERTVSPSGGEQYRYVWLV